MSNYTKLYKKYKKSIEIQEKYNHKNMKNVYIECTECGKYISFNGVNSHSKIHKNIINDKLNFFKKEYNFYTHSVLSNNIIKYSNITRENKYIVVCNSKEYSHIKSFVFQYEKYYKKCPICGTMFMSNKQTCSNVCNKKMISNKLKLYWNDDDNKIKISNRNLKISEKSKIYNIGRIPWNKGMFGEEYISHYDKADGTNSMIEAFKRSTFIQSSSIEDKVNNFLRNNDFTFQKSWFSSSKQFDFLISLKNYVIILECDGDYWHKSKRKVSDINERNMKRMEDKLKENVIYDNIKNTDKKWYVIRFWEYDINNNMKRIENYLLNMKKEEFKIPIIVNDIKKWYDEQS